MFTRVKNTFHGAYVEAVNTVTSVPTVSTFQEDRKLTPDEFVKAGDHLVSTFPVWQWTGGDPKKAKSYLPKNKQYLIFRKVPCLQRVADVVENCAARDLLDDDDPEDSWVLTEVTGDSTKPQANVEPVIADEDDDDDQAADEAAAPSTPAPSNARYYDLHMTWDKYYCVPRFWLVGFSNNKALSTTEVYEDVSADHAGNTITWDRHPHESIMGASIHPCRHASTMKKLGDLKVEAGEEFLVDHYLLLFMKFIQSIVPTLEYDYTMAL